MNARIRRRGGRLSKAKTGLSRIEESDSFLGGGSVCFVGFCFETNWYCKFLRRDVSWLTRSTCDAHSAELVLWVLDIWAGKDVFLWGNCYFWCGLLRVLDWDCMVDIWH